MRIRCCRGATRSSSAALMRSSCATSTAATAFRSTASRVQEAVLRPGDVVKIARLVLTYLGDLEGARSAPPRPAADAGRPRADDDAVARLNAARTEKIELAAGAGSDAPGSDPRDDRTRVVPRRSSQHTSPPGQVSVARMTPPAQAAPAPTRSPAPPAELPPPGRPEADFDSTRPMIRDSESKTATPVLPLSAMAAAEAVSDRPPAPRPPAAVVRSAPTPPAADPLEDWSLELRPPQPDRPAPRPEAPPRASASPGADASRLAAPAPSSLGVRALAGSLLLALVAFGLGAVPLLIWRGRIADSYDRLLIVPTALTFGAAIILFGPPLLAALAAGTLLAWWLRRG